MIKILLLMIILPFTFKTFGSEYIAYFNQTVNPFTIKSNLFNLEKIFGPNKKFVLLNSKYPINRLEKELQQIPTFKHISTNDKIYLMPNKEEFRNFLKSNKNSGLWWQKNISLEKAHEITQGDKNLIVAVLDTGVDYLHSDITQNIYTNEKEIPNNGIDDDQNGFIDDYKGFSSYSGQGSAMDDNGHGTHCAGIIAANGKLKGIAPNVTILPIKFLNNYGQGDIAKAIEGIEYSVKAGAKIISNSYGNPNSNDAFLEAIKYAHENDVLFFAAAGNAKNDNDSRGEYPANYHLDNVLSVAAINSNLSKASFSNFGQLSVDLFAPGENIYSLDVNNQYKVRSGTSMATPMAAGVAALIWSENPTFNSTEVNNILKKSTEKSINLYTFAQTPGSVHANNGVREIFPPDELPIPRSKIIEEQYLVQSDTPYLNNTSKAYVIKKPQAGYLSLNFTKIDIENGYDYLQIEDKNGKILKKITGQISPGFTQFFAQDELIVRIISDNSQTRDGFIVNKINYTSQ